MTDATHVRRARPRARLVWVPVALAAFSASACFRGKLPPRQFYRLTAPDSLMRVVRAPGPSPLTGSIAIKRYETPGIYGSGSIVYRVGAGEYGTYPSREWAIPLGEMLGSLTQGIVERRALTAGRVTYDPPSARGEQYEWRGTVREFDEVDSPTDVAASVALVAELVRVADDSIIWSGAAHETQPVPNSRSMDAVVAALSEAATRAVARLTDEAVSALRAIAAARAQDR